MRRNRLNWSFVTGALVVTILSGVAYGQSPAEQYSAVRLSCERALATRGSDAETICGRLVELSDSLEASRMLERVHALQFHGISLLVSARPKEAATRFDRAIDLRKRAQGRESESDADMASLLEMSAQAQIGLRNLPAAETLYTNSIATLERAIAALPAFRDRYRQQLDDTLRRFAELKIAMGKTADARALVERAGAVPSSTVDVALPPPRRDGSTLLLGIGPQLTADDMRQLRALVPGDKIEWFIVVNEEALQGALLAQIYLEADAVRPNLRRGSVVYAEAKNVANGKLDGKKTWARLPFKVAYAQVPLPGRDALEIRGNDDRNRPANVPETATGASLTDGQLVSLVAFLRSPADSPAAAPSNRGALYTRVQEWPIEEITKWADDNIEVRLVEFKTTARQGQRIRLKPNGSGWTIVEMGPVAW
jgi:tetratricopeptide (TPR) repeat protein